jgi:DNA-binding NarL/FixJ family response regulator
LELIRRGPPYAVVVCDMRMPVMNGSQFLKTVLNESPTTTRILLTGYADIGAAIEAVNEAQLFRFLTKPCTPDNLRAALQAALAQHRLVTAEKELLEQTLSGIVGLLTELLALTDPGIPSNALASRELVKQLARARGINEFWHLEIATVIAQLANCTTPLEPRMRAPTDDELDAMQQGTLERCLDIAHRLLSPIPRLEPVLDLLAGAQFAGGAEPSEECALLRMVLDFHLLVEYQSNSWGAMKVMRSRTTRYAPELLAALEDYWSPRDEGPAASLRFDQLEPGMELAADVVELTGNSVLVARGARLTLSLLERLKQCAATLGVGEPISVYR